MIHNRNGLRARPTSVAATVLLSLVVSLSARAADIIKNGGFEEGGRGWKATMELVEDAAAARSGTRCMMGQVTAKNRSKTLAQELDLDSKRLYRLRMWLRSPDRCRAIIHLINGKSRLEVIEAANLPRKWRQYEVLFAPRISGKQTLQFAVPSSYSARGRIGKAYIDDIELEALSTPGMPVNVTNNQGFNDFPALAAERDGALWLAWISYRDGRDELAVARLVNGKPEPVALALKHDGYVDRPCLAPDVREGVWLAWAMQVNGNWDVYAAHLVAGKKPKIVRVTSDPSVEVKASAASSRGGLWIVWEGNAAGNRDIYCARLLDGKVTDAERLTDNPTSDQNPTVCATERGHVYAAWDSFRGSNYDIYMRRRSGERWQAEVRLTREPALDRRPRLFSAADEAWIVWDNTAFLRYHFSARGKKRVRVAKVRAGRLVSPKGLFGGSMLSRYVEMGSLAFDRQRRLWISIKRPRNKRGDWDTWLLCYTGGAWSKPMCVAGALDGIARPAPIVVIGDELHVAWQSDDRPNRPERILYQGEQHSNIYTNKLLLSQIAPPVESLQLVDYTPPAEPSDLAKLREQFNEDTPTRFQIEWRGKKLNLYWGEFHEHTDISQCNARGDGTPDTNFAEMRDIARMDFGALTDHGQDMIPYDWHHLQKVTSINNDPRRFVTFLGEEWAGARVNVRDPSRKAGGYGHRNIIFADERYPRHFDPCDNTPPDKLWKILRDTNQITIPHQLADGGSRTDWYYTDEHMQPVAEIFQNRGSYEYYEAPRMARIFTPGFAIHDAWASGIVIGVIASPDHGGGGGKAGIFAPELTREAILDACRARHTYGTTAAKIFMDVRVNGMLMGEWVKGVDPKAHVRLSAKVIGAGKLKQVEVCKDNTFVHVVSPESDRVEFEFVDTQPRKKRSYYYVRAIQEDGEIAWSSPVWIEE